jgi:protoporphyrinogen/coproporphyrinogen III oxidase
MIAIVGGGITGLSAAFELASRNVPFTLFEASPRAGGLIRTDRVDGFTIEAGPDSVLVQKPAALELFDQLGLRPQVIATRPPRRAFVLKGTRLHALPSPSILGVPTTLSGIARYDLLSPAARVRVALEPLVRARGAGDESVAAFFRRRFGPETVDSIAQPLLGGIHAGDIGALSVRSLFPRLVEAEAHGSVLHAFKRRSGDADGMFRSLAGGMGTLADALVQRLPPGSVRTGSAVSSIAREASAWRVSAGGGALTASAVIVAAPAHVAGTLLGGIDARISALCAEVPYVSTVSVALAWPRAAVRHPLAGSGFVVARRHSALRITACTWVSSKWEHRAPEEAALLRVYIGGSHEPQAIDLPDADLIAIAVRDVAVVLAIDGAPILSRVSRWRNAGAQHNVGQLARMAEIERRLSAAPGLFVAGSGFRSVGIPDCIADGRAAAAAATSYVRIDA